MEKEEGFKDVLRFVRDVLAARREEKNSDGTLSTQAYNGALRAYCNVVANRWEHEKKFEKSLDEEKQQELSPEMNDRFKSLIDAVKTNYYVPPVCASLSSQRNNEESKINKDT